MSQSKIIHLIGFPGTGKFTIAKEFCKHNNFTLIDNHLINNVLFQTIDLNKKLPNKIFNYINKIYDVLLKTMSTISPLDKNFIFTNTLTNEDQHDRIFLDKIIKMSEKRDATYIPIRLICNKQELHKRLVSPERKKKMKLTDVNMLNSFISGKNIILSNCTNEITIDTSQMSPKEVVLKIQNIMEHN